MILKLELLIIAIKMMKNFEPKHEVIAACYWDGKNKGEFFFFMIIKILEI